MKKRWRFAAGISGIGPAVCVCLLLASCGGRSSETAGDGPPTGPARGAAAGGFAGSGSCRECHERFYELWATSHHGLAMQPYTAGFARENLTPQTEEVVVGEYRYRAEIDDEAGWVRQEGPGAAEQERLAIEHVLGGKNVYYFLTAGERGRLQTLPVAYNVRTEQWFDTAASGVRHAADEPVHWTHSAYTFNTACYSCHISQLSTNYDVASDSYHTTWSEPGVNCETCHGPAGEHIRVCREAAEGSVPEDLKIISVKGFSVEQHNATCSSCHAKAVCVAPSFEPGGRFFDCFGIATLEDPDFYPDGRDLGENYTYTLWRMSPCAKSGELSCVHCHTSSGRFRQKGDPDAACLPCHQERVANVAAHSRHPAESSGSRCIACHMPMTEFALMRRSDHSMLPPVPSATLRFGSPNACNLCHTEEDAAWADEWVRQWAAEDYQAPVLYRAGLIEAARRGDFDRLADMVAYLGDPGRDEVYATSLVRLLGPCDDPAKWTAILRAIEDPSPLVRSAAAEGLSAVPQSVAPRAMEALVDATADEYRLVRVRAAGSLAAYGGLLEAASPDEGTRRSVDRATAEYLLSLTSRADQWSSHYNLGNYYLAMDDVLRAIPSFERALYLEPDAVMALVNSSIAHARVGRGQKAEEYLERALAVEPDSATVHFNLGLLRAEQRDLARAEEHLRAAWQADARMHAAAYNLGLLVADDDLDEAVALVARAFELEPDPKYGYALAGFLRRRGEARRAVETLDAVIEQSPRYVDAYMLLGNIHESQDERDEAKAVYRRVLAVEGLSLQERYYFTTRLDALP